MVLRIGLTRDADFASMAFNELLCDEQSNSRAERITGSEEGFKDFRQMIRRDAHSIIGNGQLNAASRLVRVFDGYR